MQAMNERNLMVRKWAAVPLRCCCSRISQRSRGGDDPATGSEQCLDDDGRIFLSALKVAGALVLVVLLGRYSRVRHCVLLPALACGKCLVPGVIPRVWLWFAAGRGRLVDAMGAFLAGVLLASSEYRHALKAISNHLKVCCWGCFSSALAVDRLWHAD